MNGDTIITIEHLRKEYPNVTPLTDVNAQIKRGDVISVIGPSGTGKSTLLRCLNLLETPTSGKITVDGVTVTDRKCNICAVRQKMGMVFQSFNLFSHMTVIENIMCGQTGLLGRTRQQAYDRGIELLRSVGLADKAFSYPSELSGGQQQRVAIVRTLSMEPEIILFDEPTSALDPTMVGEVLSVIRGLAKQGMTMIIVTHEMKFARDVSTRIFYMDQGEIHEDGTPGQIFDNPQKERTRRFIRRLKVFEESIVSRDFDFIGVSARLEEFGRRNGMPQRTVNNLQVVFEELCVQMIMPSLPAEPSMNIVIEYSEESGAAAMCVRYNGDESDPTLGGDGISMSLVLNSADKIKYSRLTQDGELNEITLSIK